MSGTAKPEQSSQGLDATVETAIALSKVDSKASWDGLLRRSSADPGKWYGESGCDECPPASKLPPPRQGATTRRHR